MPVEESDTVRNNNQVVNQFRKQSKHLDIPHGVCIKASHAFSFLLMTFINEWHRTNAGAKITGQNKVIYVLLSE